MKPNILLGVTGSVATLLLPKLKTELEKIGNLKIVTTKPGQFFVEKAIGGCISAMQTTFPVMVDEDEWKWQKKGDEVLHIELAKWADVVVIAPLSANTLSKLARGACDNLLTSIIRALPVYKPLVIAPAMNTEMWDKQFAAVDIDWLTNIYNITCIEPQSKVLACGDEGKGAMADIDKIVCKIQKTVQWRFPLQEGVCPGIPVNTHPGSFAYHRKGYFHTGVDLYVPGSPTSRKVVTAVESGKVVKIEQFTGPELGHPHWLPTWAVAVEGISGVVVYGELEKPTGEWAGLNSYNSVGDIIRKGASIGVVSPVLPEGQERPDVPGHSRHMLHLELYKHGTREFFDWVDTKERPDFLLDPTAHLMNSVGKPLWTMT